MIIWEANHLNIDPPKHPKKITGTRFGAILGVNPWTTPFQAWCSITKIYEPPFEDTIYTLAGKTIEPKQAEYVKKTYGMSILTPADKFGADYFNTTRGDFFPGYSEFGGMWDYLQVDENGKPIAVLEMKTTKRIEDWQKDIPEYYALQASLYASLLGLDQVYMVASFLEEKDYQDPTSFKPSVSNTIIRAFKISERYPHFEKTIKTAEAWWHEHVLTGISPEYDEIKDKEYLDAIKTISLNPDTNINALLEEADELKEKIDLAYASVSEDEARLKVIKDIVRDYVVSNMKETDKKGILSSDKHTWTVSVVSSKTIDKDALKTDGLLEKYEKVSTSYRLTVN